VGQPRGRARVPINSEQRDKLRRLYEQVPTQTRVHHEWDSPGGRAFLSYVIALSADDVPLRWMAQELGLDDRVLQQSISRPQRATQ
jgi:hypothetical protein